MIRGDGIFIGSGAEKQRQYARDLLVDGEAQQPQQAQTHQRRQKADESVGAVADDDVAHGWIVVIIGKNGQPLDVRAYYVGGEHQQRLADAVPAVQLAVRAMDSEFGVVPGIHFRLGRPPGVRRLEAMRRIACAELTGLDDEGGEKRRQGQQEQGVEEQTTRAVHHPGHANARSRGIQAAAT
jgi:hypothetical protein